MDNWNTKQRVIVQVVCVLLSVILWVYVTNIENPLKTMELNKVSVQLLNSDKLAEAGQILAPNQEVTISLKLEGNIQNIYKVNKDDFTAVIDLEPYALKIGSNTIPVNIIDSPSNITIKNLSGLTATIEIEELIEKKVSVESDIAVSAKNNYYVSEAVVDPEEITVSGAKSLVDKVDKVMISGKETNIDQTIVKNYDAYAVDINGDKVDGVTLSQSMIEATIRITEGKNVPINVVTKGELKSGLKLISTDIDQNNIDISGPDELLQKISSINTEPIDLSQIQEDTSIEVQLQIPDGIESQSISSATVNITLDKLKTKEFKIPVTPSSVQDGISIALDSDKVSVSLSGYDSDLKKVTEKDITANLDLSKINAAGEYTITPDIKINSDGITINNVDSIKVTATSNLQNQSSTPEDNSTQAFGENVTSDNNQATDTTNPTESNENNENNENTGDNGAAGNTGDNGDNGDNTEVGNEN